MTIGGHLEEMQSEEEEFLASPTAIADAVQTFRDVFAGNAVGNALYQQKAQQQGDIQNPSSPSSVTNSRHARDCLRVFRKARFRPRRLLVSSKHSTSNLILVAFAARSSTS
jgi:hypothetical protein